jgi:lysophospholipase L1-like esterase
MASLAAADAAEARTIRIMPVGDSITEGGKTFSTYRYPLLKKLTDAGFNVEFVGSRQSDSPAGVLKHEGYGGKNAEFLATVMGKNFKENPADIVLIHSGHNHFIEEKPVDGIVAATESMIKTVRAINPRVTVLVAEVITSGKLPKYSYIPQLNEALRKLAARLDTPQQRVIAVNQADGFDWMTDTIGDKVHPNERGAEKMATRWLEALKPLMEKPAK